MTNAQPSGFTSRTDNPSYSPFFALAKEWGLGTDEQITLLGRPSRSTYFNWKKGLGGGSPDTEERISHLLAIYKALNILFPDPERAAAWLRRPNRFFEGRTALSVMLNGQLADLVLVRNYVDAQRGG
jgi:uncharacterized protein (DUF2384 family)